MREFEINGKKKLCFVLKNGEANDIVVTYDSLAKVDLKRFLDMEKQGGELMRVMRDTVLDNGVNALKIYDSLIKYVPVKQVAKKEVVAETTNETETPIKRGRGRPKKIKS